MSPQKTLDESAITKIIKVCFNVPKEWYFHQLYTIDVFVQWRSEPKILVGAKIFYFKRAAVFCKQVSSFFSGGYFYDLVDVSPIYSSRLPQDNVLNHITCNFPIKKTMSSVTYKDKKRKTNQPSRCRKLVTVCDTTKRCKMKKKVRSV